VKRMFASALARCLIRRARGFRRTRARDSICLCRRWTGANAQTLVQPRSWVYDLAHVVQPRRAACICRHALDMLIRRCFVQFWLGGAFWGLSPGTRPSGARIPDTFVALWHATIGFAPSQKGAERLLHSKTELNSEPFLFFSCNFRDERGPEL